MSRNHEEDTCAVRRSCTANYLNAVSASRLCAVTLPVTRVSWTEAIPIVSPTSPLTTIPRIHAVRATPKVVYALRLRNLRGNQGSKL
jgi:hypothetical protein